MRRLLLIVAVLLTVGVGCAAPKVRHATRADVSFDFPMMPGLEPRDEAQWRFIGTDSSPLIETTWQTTALFDKVVAYYDEAITKQWAFSTSTDEDQTGVRMSWAPVDGSHRAGSDGYGDFLYVWKAQQDGKTIVRIVMKPGPARQ